MKLFSCYKKDIVDEYKTNVFISCGKSGKHFFLILESHFESIFALFRTKPPEGNSARRICFSRFNAGLFYDTELRKVRYVTRRLYRYQTI